MEGKHLMSIQCLLEISTDILLVIHRDVGTAVPQVLGLDLCSVMIDAHTSRFPAFDKAPP